MAEELEHSLGQSSSIKNGQDGIQVVSIFNDNGKTFQQLMEDLLENSLFDA